MAATSDRAGAGRDDARAAARAGDPERYLAALLSPAEVQDDLLALAAFGAEIARIPHLVTEPMMGEIRLQWWRDILPGLAEDAVTGNPVADALGLCVRRHGLPQGLILGMLDARAFDLYADPMPDEQTFRAYLAKSEGALIELSLRVLGGWPPGTAASAIVETGQAVGLVRVLASLPAMLAKGRCALPATRLRSAGIEPGDLAAMPIGDPARRLVRSFHADARAALAKVAAQWRRIPQRERAALLPAAMVEPQLRALEHKSLHPGRDLAVVLPVTRVWRIWQAHAIGRILGGRRSV